MDNYKIYRTEFDKISQEYNDKIDNLINKVPYTRIFLTLEIIAALFLVVPCMLIYLILCICSFIGSFIVSSIKMDVKANKPIWFEFFVSIFAVMFFAGMLFFFYPNRCPTDTIEYHDCCINSNLTCVIDTAKYVAGRKQYGIFYIILSLVGMFIQISICMFMYCRNKYKVKPIEKVENKDPESKPESEEQVPFRTISLKDGSIEYLN